MSKHWEKNTKWEHYKDGNEQNSKHMFIENYVLKQFILATVLKVKLIGRWKRKGTWKGMHQNMEVLGLERSYISFDCLPTVELKQTVMVYTGHDRLT